MKRPQTLDVFLKAFRKYHNYKFSEMTSKIDSSQEFSDTVIEGQQQGASFYVMHESVFLGLPWWHSG